MPFLGHNLVETATGGRLLPEIPLDRNPGLLKRSPPLPAWAARSHTGCPSAAILAFPPAFGPTLSGHTYFMVSRRSRRVQGHRGSPPALVRSHNGLPGSGPNASERATARLATIRAGLAAGAGWMLGPENRCYPLAQPARTFRNSRSSSYNRASRHTLASRGAHRERGGMLRGRRFARFAQLFGGLPMLIGRTFVGRAVAGAARRPRIASAATSIISWLSASHPSGSGGRGGRAGGGGGGGAGGSGAGAGSAAAASATGARGLRVSGSISDDGSTPLRTFSRVSTAHLSRRCARARRS